MRETEKKIEPSRETESLAHPVGRPDNQVRAQKVKEKKEWWLGSACWVEGSVRIEFTTQKTAIRISRTGLSSFDNAFGTEKGIQILRDTIFSDFRRG